MCGAAWRGGRAGRAGQPRVTGAPCRRAKLLLKKKRYREQLLDKTENQITSLETMVGGGGGASGSDTSLPCPGPLSPQPRGWVGLEERGSVTGSWWSPEVGAGGLSQEDGWGLGCFSEAQGSALVTGGARGLRGPLERPWCSPLNTAARERSAGGGPSWARSAVAWAAEAGREARDRERPRGPLPAGPARLPLPQVQSIEFTQIETKVLEGLRLGNECLNRMHQVGPWGLGPAAVFVPGGRGGGPAPRHCGGRAAVWPDGRTPVSTWKQRDERNLSPGPTDASGTRGKVWCGRWGCGELFWRASWRRRAQPHLRSSLQVAGDGGATQRGWAGALPLHPGRGQGRGQSPGWCRAASAARTCQSGKGAAWSLPKRNRVTCPEKTVSAFL